MGTACVKIGRQTTSDDGKNNPLCKGLTHLTNLKHLSKIVSKKCSYHKKYRLSQKEEVRPNLLPFPYKSSYILDKKNTLKTFLFQTGVCKIHVL